MQTLKPLDTTDPQAARQLVTRDAEGDGYDPGEVLAYLVIVPTIVPLTNKLVILGTWGGFCCTLLNVKVQS